MTRLADCDVQTAAEFRSKIDALLWAGGLSVGEQVRVYLKGDFLDETGAPVPKMVELAQDAIGVNTRPGNVFASVRGTWAGLPGLCCDITRERL